MIIVSNFFYIDARLTDLQFKATDESTTKNL